jgi:RNA polymerase sigma-70 factor (ECF subfamily)
LTSSRVIGEKLLVERARRGDRQAISELYRRHVGVIHRYVYARVGDPAMAEDLTAQVFLKALEGLPDYEPGSTPFVAWLYRIAQARTIDHWRRLERRREVALDAGVPADDPQPVELLEVEAEWSTAVDLLAQLSDDQQAVILLRFIGEMSLQDVATTLGKTIGAVKSLQFRALASLTRLLQERRAGEQHA